MTYLQSISLDIAFARGKVMTEQYLNRINIRNTRVGAGARRRAAKAALLASKSR